MDELQFEFDTPDPNPDPKNKNVFRKFITQIVETTTLTRPKWKGSS